MSKVDDDVLRLYEQIKVLEGKVDKLSRLSERIFTLEKNQKILINFILSLKPLLNALKKFNLFKIF